MNRHRCARVGAARVAGAAALVLAATALLAACATTAANTSLGSASRSATPLPGASVATPAPAGSVPPTGSPGPTHATGHPTHTHTAPPPPPSSMPASQPPPFAGDWSVSTHRTPNGHLECSWVPEPDGNVFIGGWFNYYYSGPNHPKTVDYQVTNSVNSSVVTGTLTYTTGLDGDTRSGNEVLGFENPPFKQDGYATITVTLLPGGADNRPSDDSVTMTVVTKAGIPPGSYTIDC